jgi:hypothetical protein
VASIDEFTNRGSETKTMADLTREEIEALAVFLDEVKHCSLPSDAEERGSFDEETSRAASALRQLLSATEARYFIGGDNSGHEYVVPVDRHTEWNAWTELPEDDERGWTEPVYAMRIDGTLTFCAPTLFYGPLPSPLTEGE